MMSNTPLQVLIVDDDVERSQDWATKIDSFGFSSITVRALDTAAAKGSINAAIERRKQTRNRVDPFESDIVCELDSIDVLIVDYDLQELLGVGYWSTGLQVTTLARAFTRVKLIVLVNQFGTNTFDLTLVKDAQSYSDFDIGSDQLVNPAFWDRSRLDGYAPWAWNDGVLRAASRMAAACNWVMQNLDQPVLQTLGFSTDLDDTSTPETYISKELWQGCLGNPAYTFRELVSESEFLTEADRKMISKFDVSCARVATAFVSHWLDRWVIPSNEVLIDLPHLASSSPWLLTKKDDLACWQTTTSLDQGFTALLEGVKKHEYNPGFPLSRPVVWRRKVIADEALVEPAGFDYNTFPDLVFCEDTSQFHEFDNCRPFPSRLPSSDTQRFVADPEKVKPHGEGKSLDGVLYEPSVFFSL